MDLNRGSLVSEATARLGIRTWDRRLVGADGSTDLWRLLPHKIFVNMLFLYLASSVTRLRDFLHFGQPFKASGNNYFTQIAHIVRQFL